MPTVSNKHANSQQIFYGSLGSVKRRVFASDWSDESTGRLGVVRKI